MGNVDSMPIISQAKSLGQVIGGDAAGARRTQENFSRQCPVVSQCRSLGEVIGGDAEAARRTQRQFAEATPGVRIVYHIADGRGGNLLHDLGQDAAALVGGVVTGLVGDVVNAADGLQRLRGRMHDWIDGAAVAIICAPGPDDGSYFTNCFRSEARLMRDFARIRGASSVAEWTPGGSTVPDFLRSFLSAGGKRLIYYTGHGVTGTGAWSCGRTGSVSPRALRDIIAGRRSPGLTAVVSDSCFSGRIVEELSACAFAVSSGQADESTRPEFTRWFCSEHGIAAAPFFSSVKVRGALGSHN